MRVEDEAGPGSPRVLRYLVVLFIAWVAYWAATAGLERIVGPEEPTSTIAFTL